MRKFFSMAFVALLSVVTIGINQSFGQNVDVIQSITPGGDFESIGASTTILKVSGYPTGASSIDLSSAESTGRRLTIVNYAAYDILFSQIIRVDGGLTTFVGALSKSPNTLDPLMNGVTITIVFDGTSWIRI